MSKRLLFSYDRSLVYYKHMKERFTGQENNIGQDADASPESSAAARLVKNLRERLPRWAENPSMGLILGAAIFVSALGSYEGFQASQYMKLRQKRQILEQAIEVVDPERRAERVKELFGDHVKFGDVEGAALESAYEQSKEVEAEIAKMNPLTWPAHYVSGDINVPEGGNSKPFIDSRVSSDLPGVQGEGDFAPGVESRLPKEALDEVLRQTYPKGWYAGQVADVRYEDRTQPIGAAYGLEAGAEAWAHATGSREIVFFKPQKQKTLAKGLECLGHELGHENSWDNVLEVDVSTRMALILEVASRVQSPDRYASWYVNSINNKDKKLELACKSTEYWAEITEEYFEHPENMNIKDYRLVDDWVKKRDPNFDPIKAREERKRILELERVRSMVSTNASAQRVN